MTRPMVHFALLGGLLFAASQWMQPLPPALPAAVDAGDDAVLFSEALRLGLERDDPVVQGRLLQNMRFLDAAGDPASLLRQARALGMERSDVVVQRRLATLMRMRLQATASQVEPGEDELAAYLRAHGERFTGPPRVRFSHVFLSRARRGDALMSDARRVLAELVASGADPFDAAAHGDPLPVPGQIPLTRLPAVAQMFGPRFARAVAGMAPGAWAGPIESPYGLHLVWVHALQPPAPPPLSAVRAQVRAAVLAERREAAAARALAQLRAAPEVAR